jgi:hypothetical protein
LLEKAATQDDKAYPDMYLKQAFNDGLFTEDLLQLIEDTNKMNSVFLNL